MFWFVPYFLPLLFSMTSCGKLVETGNGNYAITGKGCGITTQLKYMSEIPRDHESYECVIIVNPTQPLIVIMQIATLTTVIVVVKTLILWFVTNACAKNEF